MFIELKPNAKGCHNINAENFRRRHRRQDSGRDYVLPWVRVEYPEAYFFGEVIHADYAGFVRETGVKAVTQSELWKAIWSALNDRNFFELAWARQRHNSLLENFVPQTFVGNHGVTRIASQSAEDRHLPHALVSYFSDVRRNAIDLRRRRTGVPRHQRTPRRR